MATDMNLELWSKYIQQIAQVFGLGQTNTAFQVLTMSYDLRLTDRTELQRQLNQFANQLPVWGIAYKSSGVTIIQAYRDLLAQMMSVPSANPGIQNELAKHIEILMQISQEIITVEISIARDWLKLQKQFEQIGVEVPRFEDFSKPFKPRLEGLQAHYNEQLRIISDILKAGLDRSLLSNAMVQLIPQLEAKDLAPPFVYTPDVWSLLSQWMNDDNRVPLTITFQKGSRSYDYSNSIWEMANGLSSSIFFSSRNREQQTSLITLDSSYTFELEFASQARFIIHVGENWFNGSLLKLYENGPWIEGSEISKGEAQAWRKNGIFPLRSTEAYIVYQPKIKISLDDITYMRAKETILASVNIELNVGPFIFGGAEDGLSENIHVDFDDTVNQILITDLTKSPKIIAVIVVIMP